MQGMWRSAGLPRVITYYVLDKLICDFHLRQEWAVFRKDSDFPSDRQE